MSRTVGPGVTPFPEVVSLMPEADPTPDPERSRSSGVPLDRAAPSTSGSSGARAGFAAQPGVAIASGSGSGSPLAASSSSERSRRDRSEPTLGSDPEPVAPLALPHLGEKIDEFRLLESIGAGGMGAVYRAIDVGLDRQVALKILPPEQAVDPEVVRRYHQEGRAAAKLDHENVARVYTIGDDGRFHYIAFEYIEGVTIRQKVIQDGPLPVRDAVHFTLQIAQALIHAAEREVIHRDIKPSNIIITPTGQAKLVDMGLARQFERGGEPDLTQTGMTLGTFDYISPEQARDPRDVDIRGDLYSLGCTLFHMLSGRPPFPGGTVLQKLFAAPRGHPARHPQAEPGCAGLPGVDPGQAAGQGPRPPLSDPRAPGPRPRSPGQPPVDQPEAAAVDAELGPAPVLGRTRAGLHARFGSAGLGGAMDRSGCDR